MTANAPTRFKRASVALLVALQLPHVASAQSPTAMPPMAGGMGMDRVIRTFILAQQIEVHANAAERPVDFEIVSWIGGDYRRIFLRLQGEQSTLAFGGGSLQADALMGRLISPFWSIVGGARVDTRPRTRRSAVPSEGRLTRGMFAFGLLGLAPGWFEMEPTLFVSDKGDLSFEFESSLDLLVTQRLILQPWLEVDAAAQAVPEIGVRSGLNDVEIGGRVRYEVRRKFAPYIGVSWLRRTGQTAASAHDATRVTSGGTITAGVRMWR